MLLEQNGCALDIAIAIRPIDFFVVPLVLLMVLACDGRAGTRKFRNRRASPNGLDRSCVS